MSCANENSNGLSNIRVPFFQKGNHNFDIRLLVQWNKVSWLNLTSSVSCSSFLFVSSWELCLFVLSEKKKQRITIWSLKSFQRLEALDSSRQSHLSLSLTTQVQFLGPTWWKERGQALLPVVFGSLHIHPGMCVHTRMYISIPHKQIGKNEI